MCPYITLFPKHLRICPDVGCLVFSNCQFAEMLNERSTLLFHWRTVEYISNNHNEGSVNVSTS